MPHLALGPIIICKSPNEYFIYFILMGIAYGQFRTQLERKHPKLASLGVETEFPVDRKVPREAKLRKDAPPHLKVSLADSH